MFQSRISFYHRLHELIFHKHLSWQFKKSLWDVLTGRKDGRVSQLSDVNANLPSAASDFTTLQNLFSRKGLDINDLVALSGKLINMFYR